MRQKELPQQSSLTQYSVRPLFHEEPNGLTTNYYTTRHLHEGIGEHKHSAIGRHLEDHGLSKSDLKDKQFYVMRKCKSKYDCLIFEMLFIK